MNIEAAANMMNKYGLLEDEALMETWLDQTHGLEHMPWRNYLLFWSDAKEKFLTKVFNNQLIYKFDIISSKTPFEMKTEMEGNNIFRHKISACLESFREIVLNFLKRRYKVENKAASSIYDYLYFCHYDYTDAINIIEGGIGENLPDAEITLLQGLGAVVGHVSRTLYDFQSLSENRCNFSVSFRIPEENKDFIIFRDQKPIKALTSFAKYMKPYVDEPLFTQFLNDVEDFRISHSQILNTKNVHGKLCLSIHPMDYMTMSDNDCDWSSCMRWRYGEGEYHAGTLEMMTSSSVVMAYLESKEPWHPVHDEKTWSNKKWRELFIVTPDFITGIKGYPYHSDSLEKTALDKLAELVEKNCGITFNTTDVQCQHGKAITPSGATLVFGTCLMYNDTEWSNVHTIFANNCGITSDEEFFYGTGAYCIQCGRLRTDEDEEEGYRDSLVCEYCSDRVRCSHCGIIISERHYYVDPCDDPLCDDCYDTLRYDDLIQDRWGFDDDQGDFYTVALRLKDGFSREIRIRYDTYDDLDNAGVLGKHKLQTFFNWTDMVIDKPIPNDPRYIYLKQGLAEWERLNDNTIEYIA